MGPKVADRLQTRKAVRDVCCNIVFERAHPEDEERHSQDDDLIARMESCNDLVDTAGVGRRYKSDCQCRKGDHEGDCPFLPLREVQRVAMIRRDEFDAVWIFFCARAMIVVVEDGGGEKGVREEDLPVGGIARLRQRGAVNIGQSMGGSFAVHGGRA